MPWETGQGFGEGQGSCTWAGEEPRTLRDVLGKKVEFANPPVSRFPVVRVSGGPAPHMVCVSDQGKRELPRLR